MIRNKTIKFNLDKPDERKLWEWLQRLPHGQFSEEVKGYWMKKMKRPKSDEPSELSDWLEKQTEEHLNKIWPDKEEKK